MDCRKLLWMGSLALGSLIGCTRREVISTDPYNPMPVENSAASKSIGKRGGRVIRRKEPDDLVTQADGKPETLVKIAEVQSQLATDESRPAEQRQKALSLAKHNFQRAIQLDNRYVPAYLGLGRLCSITGDHASALTILDQGLARVPNDASLWFERGMVLGRQQRFDDAIQHLMRSSQLEPHNVQYTKSVGLMLARAGRPDEGVSWLGRVMPDAEARYNVGRMMEHIGRPEEARRQFELALRSNPNHRGAIAALEPLSGETTELVRQPTVTTTSTGPVRSAAYVAPPWEMAPTEPSKMTISVEPTLSDPTIQSRQLTPTSEKRKAVRIAFEPGD